MTRFGRTRLADPVAPHGPTDAEATLTLLEHLAFGTSVPRGIEEWNYPRLLAIFRAHRLGTWLANVPAWSAEQNRVRNQARASRVLLDVHNRAAVALIGELQTRLAARGAASLVIKGGGLIGTVYTDPGEREMRDVDLVLREADVPAAAEVFRDLGGRLVVNPVQDGWARHLWPTEYVFEVPSPSGSPHRIEVSPPINGVCSPYNMMLEHRFDSLLDTAQVLDDGRRIPADDLHLLIVILHACYHGYGPFVHWVDAARMDHGRDHDDDRLLDWAEDLGTAPPVRAALAFTRSTGSRWRLEPEHAGARPTRDPCLARLARLWQVEFHDRENLIHLEHHYQRIPSPPVPKRIALWIFLRGAQVESLADLTRSFRMVRNTIGQRSLRESIVRRFPWIPSALVRSVLHGMEITATATGTLFYVLYSLGTVVRRHRGRAGAQQGTRRRDIA